MGPADAQTALGRALANLKGTLEESGAVVTHDPLPTVKADPRQLVQVFQNLIANAVKFRDSRPPRVHISADRDGRGWRFTVRDNGKGMEVADLERIFLIFQRLHARGEYPGTGVGLAICKRIVERHGGRIWADSELGEGSVFMFTVPENGTNGE